MKKLVSSLVVLMVVLQSCKEQLPSGLVLVPPQFVDKAYVAAPETAQTKNVLIEELTGASCVNCPDGSKILHDMILANPNRIILTAIHSGFLTTPPPGSKYDFRNADANALRLSFNEGDPNKPSVTFDRSIATSGSSAGKMFIEKGQTASDWFAMLPTRLSKTTPVNIHLTSSYNVATNKVDIKATLAFTSDVTERLALSLYVLESGKADKQEGKDVNGIPIEIEDYDFEHVMKKMVSSVSGDLILDSLVTKPKGVVLERTFSFAPELYSANNVNGLVLDSCVIVGAVHKTGTSKEVLHVEEVKLK